MSVYVSVCVRVIAENKSDVCVRVYVHAFENQASSENVFMLLSGLAKDYHLPLLSKYMCHVALVFRIPPYGEFMQHNFKICYGHVRMRGKLRVCSPNIQIQMNMWAHVYIFLNLLVVG